MRKCSRFGNALRLRIRGSSDRRGRRPRSFPGTAGISEISADGPRQKGSRRKVRYGALSEISAFNYLCCRPERFTTSLRLPRNCFLFLGICKKPPERASPGAAKNNCCVFQGIVGGSTAECDLNFYQFYICHYTVTEEKFPDLPVWRVWWAAPSASALWAQRFKIKSATFGKIVVKDPAEKNASRFIILQNNFLFASKS